MGQHDFVVDNSSGANVRIDLNNALQALAGLSSGVAEPTTKYAYQFWADTTTGLLKIRNAANDAWLIVGTLASAYLGLADIATANNFTASQKLKGDALLWRFKDTGGSGVEWGIRSDGGNFELLRNDGTEGSPSWTLVQTLNSDSGTSKWTALTAATDFSTTAASTSTITMSTDQTANILVGYAIKFTLSGVVYYGQVTALTSNLMTIRGAPLTTGAGALTALSYSDLPSQVDVIDLSVDGYYEDGTDATLILTDMRKRLVWEASKAYIVGWDMSQITVDTGTECNVTVMVNAAAVGTANTNQGPTMSGTANTVVSTVVDINTANYDINRGELLDVQVTSAGNGNARDMTLIVTVVYP